jgi:hypothetical protein
MLIEPILGEALQGVLEPIVLAVIVANLLIPSAMIALAIRAVRDTRASLGTAELSTG